MPELLKDITTEGRWPLQGQFYSSLFERYVRFAVEDQATLDYVRSCVEYVNAWDEAMVQALCEASIRYCQDFQDMVGEDAFPFASYRDVLQRVTPVCLYIPNPERPEPVAFLEFTCEWEEEHGMDWIVRGQEVLYVGGSNGEKPWDSFRPKRSWNHA